MESPKSVTPIPPPGRTASTRSRSSSKLEDVASLTSFNPFAEEDEHDNSSYAIVSSIFSKVKNTLAAPLTSATSSTPAPSSSNANAPQNGSAPELRRPSIPTSSSNISNKSNAERRNPLPTFNTKTLAQPTVSATPAISEPPPAFGELERTPSQGASVYSPDGNDNSGYGTFIPGFPMPDSDARSIRTTASMNNIKRTASVSKVIRKLRGEGLSRDYWMDDELCKECYDCKSVFTAWRRKHHCRICGQVYCSRCASHIIKGHRFGQDGAIRVCNLCLDKLQTVGEDEDDSRSISSTTSPFAAHQLGTDARFINLAHLPQSPFAASQLFGRNDSFSLFSIAETKRPYAGSDDSGLGSRSGTPDLGDLPQHVPFRRTLTEEEKEPASETEQAEADQPPLANVLKTPVEFPVTVPVALSGSSSTIAFPVSSPDQGSGFDSPGGIRSRYNSFAELHGPSFVRSRVHSRLGEIEAGEAGWRTRRESTAYAQELNTISMFHLRIMLRQMLTTENIPNIREWEETLLKLALRIARELTFAAQPHRQGADMDVRRYVKIKKIPGGSPKNSEYVDGAVITKNVAHRNMSQKQRNPRIMLVTFPLEFHRIEGQYVHFGQILLQEKDYLGNLASRIAALRPHVVLVEKSVSRLVLDALADRKIAVARAVKPSAIQFVSRMTQCDVFSSMDKLALEPRLGHCANFQIQTFDHPLIPGRRKTYMRFEGCNREMGCTIILRGGDIDVLKRVKKVTRFLAFIVRNLRLETHLWKDSVITLPALSRTATPSAAVTSIADVLSPTKTSSPLTQEEAFTQVDSPSPDGEDLQGEEAEQRRLSKRIQESLEPYEKTFISVSATLRFPPPYPIRRMKELDDELRRVKQEWEDDLVRREEQPSRAGHHQEETATQQSVPGVVIPAAVDTSDLVAQIDSLQVPDMSRTPTPGILPPSEPDYFTLPRAPSLSSSMPSSMVSSPAPIIVEEQPIKPRSAEDIALESRLSYVKWQHEEQRRIWEWYLRKNKDDFDVEKYQCISMWEFTIPIAEYGLHRACFAPQLHYTTFYGNNDCTLGQFIEKSVRETLIKFLDPKAICGGNRCGQPIARHCRVYVHNESRLFVAVEQWDGQINDPMGYHAHASPESIITWSACRVCGSATPFIPVSEEMQRYSFAKFLELHFYPADVQLVQGAGCQHNIYRHHIRYFANQGMTVRFQADPIIMHEIVYPPMRIRVRPEAQLEIKNRDFERLHHRNNVWYSALIDDLKLINIDAATGDEEADAMLTTQINALILRAEAEKNEVTTFINKVYTDSSPTDTLALNQVRARRQDLIVAWQADFDKLPKPRLTQLTDKNVRRLSAFDSVRAIWPRRELEFLHGPSANISETEDYGGRTMRRVTGDSFISSASEASETESITEEPVPQCEAEPSPMLVTPATEPGPDVAPMSPKSEPESDSTIGAPAGDRSAPENASFHPVCLSFTSAMSELLTSAQDAPDAAKPEVDEESHTGERLSHIISRLPRRTTQHPSVAELVKRYQEYLPPQGVEELAKTALQPTNPISESEQETSREISAHSRVRGKRSQQFLTRKSSMSDFEYGYAANIAPKYLTHTRRTAGHTQHTSRIPSLMIGSFESRTASRRSSPDKRPTFSRMHTDATIRGGRVSPPPGKQSSTGPFIPKNKGKGTLRAVPSRDRLLVSRPTASSGAKSTTKRTNAPGSKVSNIAKHFERMNRDNERSSRRYAVIRGRRARPVATARARVEILESIKDAIKDEESDDSGHSEADDEGGGDEDEIGLDERSPKNSLSPPLGSIDAGQGSGQETALAAGSDGASGQEQLAIVLVAPEQDKLAEPPTPDAQIINSAPPSPAMPPIPSTPAMSPPELDLAGAAGERTSILKTLAGFWPQQTQATRQPNDDDPMSDPEHIFRDSSMVVRTDEPTSIIALALNSPQYRDMLTKSRAEKRQAREPKLTDGGEAFMPDDHSVADSTSTWGVVNVDSTDDADPTEELRVPSSKYPWAISFESGGLTISCTVLFAEQFDALRRTYDCEKSLIESLARPLANDRFIAKELSRAELQAMETFAPAYFDYMSSAVVAHRPTLLAKIFGCYKISFRKTHKDKGIKSKPTQMNLLVMENLFYDRRFSKIYDLKGSTRNRHVRSTGRENEVLLDENLVETAHLAPFYLREHSKRILRGALYNDSRFLADINVMDYSLVVGVDSTNNELVVGIVDYIRTYTWDKKLESWVKDSAFLGGANRGEPTIVGPKQYRQRFLSAMERYFPLVPDRWMKQHDAPEEEGNNLLELWPDW
ncbi:uncharacterized protein PHACADRAFT_190619 [Phanerochaete carnosa HHB-10118-sp]|uniref:1-phosphatidylinositol-3-phosphate 5-kinase n=1 Tax=Phanerochaete carnosa (strain HHB-10118-sp) TaxID=650164 RepID=K5WQE6_PHACS|nr:uncharacterized protein PHACADRAFT_190619 [Phanerochaete carnosa HHB-10118-sp]EKM61454.1 hypothetical protein PHACADRAFT_190619 [Phanerochaete carnosa HHB-10118-sp]